MKIFITELELKRIINELEDKENKLSYQRENGTVYSQVIEDILDNELLELKSLIFKLREQLSEKL